MGLFRIALLLWRKAIVMVMQRRNLIALMGIWKYAGNHGQRACGWTFVMFAVLAGLFDWSRGWKADGILPA